MSPRIMIAGTGSGSGKTSITIALLGALSATGKKAVSFKCGPDYIDPMFHREVMGIESHNLDVFLHGEENITEMLADYSCSSDIAVLEGVMGFYDGIMSIPFASSSFELSEITKTPVLLVVSCKGKAMSVAAEINGFVDFMPNHICGVVLNHVSHAMVPYYRSIIKERCAVPFLGYLPYIPEAVIKERKLGLEVTEMQRYRETIDILAETGLKTLNIDEIVRIAGQAEHNEAKASENYPESKAVIAVAKDEAFVFHYPDNHEIMRKYGAEITFFSPLHDEKLPDGISGLWLGGGYFEQYVGEISANKAMLESIRSAVKSGLPTFAEGGGYVLLTKELGVDSKKYPLAGVFKHSVTVEQRLQNFGYHTLTATEDNMLMKAGESTNVHEFHYFASDVKGEAFEAVKPGKSEARLCSFAKENIFAGFAYHHFGGDELLTKRFVNACRKYSCEL